MSTIKPSINPSLYRIDPEMMKDSCRSSSEKSARTIERLSDNELKLHLKAKAKNYIKTGSFFPHRCFELEEEENGVITRHIPSVMMVHENFKKLFEGIYINDVSQSITDYLFATTLGFDSYFNCPVIIIHDGEGNVVDLIKYRPNRKGYDNLPKYLQEKSINKPKSRGEAFLYPFQTEMERLIKKEGFAFIGEGIKNALNALVRSVPFVSIESVSNVGSKKIIDYVANLHKDGIKIFSAMDGDKAGRKAFEEIRERFDFSIDNLLDFESDMDFTDY